MFAPASRGRLRPLGEARLRRRPSRLRARPAAERRSSDGVDVVARYAYRDDEGYQSKLVLEGAGAIGGSGISAPGARRCALGRGGGANTFIYQASAPDTGRLATYQRSPPDQKPTLLAEDPGEVVAYRVIGFDVNGGRALVLRATASAPASNDFAVGGHPRWQDHLDAARARRARAELRHGAVR